MGEIGAYFQCYKQPYATYKVLESYRKYYPTETIVLLSDNGYNYEKMAKHFNCIYIHDTINTHLIYESISEIDKGRNGGHIKWGTNLINRLINAYSLIKEPYFFWLEDDVIINEKINISDLNSPPYTINGYSPNMLWHSCIDKFSSKYLHINKNKCYRWSGGGGSIFNKTKMVEYLQNTQVVQDLLENWRYYNLTSNIVCDFLQSMIVHLHDGGTVGPCNGIADGPINTIVKLKVQHQYKRYYNIPMPNEISYLVNIN